MIYRLCLTAVLAAAPSWAAAHQLVVFASVDCSAVTVEAKFSNGRIAQQGDIRILDADNALLQTLSLTETGTAIVPLEGIDTSAGLVVEVDTGSHENYWIVTPEDIARNCGS